jgi:hypothetical protein
LLFAAGAGTVAALAALGFVLLAQPAPPPLPDAIAEAPAAEAVLEPTAAPAPIAETPSEPPLRTPAAEAALARLGDALRPTTAAHDVAESLQRGDSDEAAERLRELARASDQLSTPARRELARALDNAGRATQPLSEPLAQAEQAAGVALTRMQYEPERAALETLAQRVEQTGNNTLPPEIAKSMQSAAAESAESKPGAAQGGGEEDPNAPVGNEKGTRPGQEAIQSSNGKGEDIIASPVNARSRLGRISAGLEVGGNPVGDPTNPLGVGGVPLPLDNVFADDRGRGPAKPDAPVVKITDSPQSDVDKPGVHQVGEPLQVASEQTRETPSRRQVVRTFFDPRDRGPR